MSINTKIGASAVNCTTALAVALPSSSLAPDWRYTAILTFFSIQQLERCPGMIVLRQRWRQRPKSLLYSLLYTASFASMFWYVWFPLDIALINGAAQLMCLYITGNTLHGYITGARTMDTQEQMLDHVMRGLCPSCEAQSSLRNTGFSDHFKCEKCDAVFNCGPFGMVSQIASGAR
jgi:hypothetical protein